MTRDELRTKVAAAQAAAERAKPTAEEQEEQDLLAQLAAAEAVVRARTVREREAAAAVAADGSYTVQAIDMVSLFPAGKAPSEKWLMGGVIVVRDPPPEAERAVLREVEHKTGPGAKSVDQILADLLCASTVDPAPGSAGAVVLREFCGRYPAAATQAASAARQLGGARAAEAKRGSA